MNKYFYISIISIIFLSISIIIFKPNNKKNTIDNSFTKYSFYKEELNNEYLNYQKETDYSDKDVILHVNMGLNKPFYTNTKKVTKFGNTILVNKYNYLTKDYIPNDLVTLNEYSKNGLKLNKEAYESFKIMAKVMKEDNLHIRIVSAYRSYNYQENLYNNYLKYDPKEIVDTYSARPGYSEHQTGLAIDVDNTLINYDKFHLTQEFTWMKNNAYKYGFILRYGIDQQKITGYKYEPWHFRYVGKNIAEYIYKKNITYEEYYYEFLDK